MQPEGHHIAEMNLGVLRHDWDDPRVKDFMDGLGLVNGVAERCPGFVWRMDDAEMDAAQRDAAGPLGGNPRLASTLSVWESVAALEHFVWNTVHRAFYARKAEWYDLVETPRLVMWWVPAGHRPCVAEGMEQFRSLERDGNSDHAFGWSHLEEAKLWRMRGCAATAAE